MHPAGQGFRHVTSERLAGCSVRGMTVKPGWARKHPAAAKHLPPTPEKADKAVAPEQRSIWDLNRNEQRSMMITVVGGLGSIIAGACVIGGAIASARYLESISHHHTHWSRFAVASFIAFLVGGLILWLISKRWANLPKGVRWFGVAFVSLACSWYLLVWIGLAAGIH